MKQTTREVKELRGCERRIYYVRDAGSPYFEEAYLVLKPAGKRGREDAREAKTLAEEAERIIRESGGRYLNRRKPAPPVSRLSPPLAFFLGAGASSVLIGGAALIAVLL
jgi:hypothetical protein